MWKKYAASLLNGLEEIQEGEVRLDDQVVNPNKKNLSKNREKIGMVFQSYDLFPHLTILQNVTLAPIKVKKRNRREVEKEALELLERVGLCSKKMIIRDSFQVDRNREWQSYVPDHASGSITFR